MAMATLLSTGVPVAQLASRTSGSRGKVAVAALGRPSLLPSRPIQSQVFRQQTSGPARARRASLVVRADREATLDLEDGAEGGTDYSGILAVLGYAAVHFNKIHVDTHLLLKAFALYTLANTAVNLVTRKGFGEKISQVIAPATLAVFALNLSHISFLDMATLGFGYFLAEKLEPGNLFWAFIATLVAAVYYDYGTMWYASAVGVVSLTKLWRANEDKKPLPVLLLGVVLASAWAVYKEQHYIWALVLYLAQTLWAALRTGQRVVDHVSD